MKSNLQNYALLTTKKNKMCGQEKQHHTLYSSSNFEKNESKLLSQSTPIQLEKIPCSCRFLLWKLICDQKVIVMRSILHFHIALSQKWMVSGQMMLKTLLALLKTVGKFVPETKGSWKKKRRANKATQNNWQWTVGGYVKTVFEPHNIDLLKK
jgi:hypothetical protein